MTDVKNVSTPMVLVAVVVVVGLATAAIVTSEWTRLRSAYGPALDPTGIEGRWTVAIADASRTSQAAYPDAVAVRFLDGGVDLWQRAPLGLIFRPMHLPVSAVRRCELFFLHTTVWATGLWLEREGRWVIFESGRDDALAWCHARGLPVVDKAPNRPR
jgi:hypothetical protein